MRDKTIAGNMPYTLTRGKINGMPYTDDCNQCSEMFNFFNSSLGCMLDKFWLLF
jgi:hypothetical protein